MRVNPKASGIQLSGTNSKMHALKLTYKKSVSSRLKACEISYEWLLIITIYFLSLLVLEPGIVFMA